MATVPCEAEPPIFDAVDALVELGDLGGDGFVTQNEFEPQRKLSITAARCRVDQGAEAIEVV
jgi:hypothetical protein